MSRCINDFLSNLIQHPSCKLSYSKLKVSKAEQKVRIMNQISKSFLLIIRLVEEGAAATYAVVVIVVAMVLGKRHSAISSFRSLEKQLN